MAAPKKTAVAVPKAKAKLNLPANLAEDMANEIAQFKGRIAGPSGNRIKADEKIFTLPNGDTHDTLNVIIVEFVSFNAYYDAPWNPNAIVPPNCFALGLEPASLVPSDNSPEKQAESCASCWANQWDSSATGKGKACNNTKLLAVIAPDADSDTPLLLLKVTATALKNFDAYVTSTIRTLQRPPRGVVTQITFDQNVKYSSLRFSDPQPCTPDQMALAYSRRDEAMEVLMKEPDVSGFAAAATTKAKPKPQGKALRKAA